MGSSRDEGCEGDWGMLEMQIVSSLERWKEIKANV